MTRHSHRTTVHQTFELAAFAWIAVLIGCTDPASPRDVFTDDVRLAKGGPAAGGVSVTAAKPDTAQQGTTLDVTISGSGFTSDMEATWELDGVSDPSQVRTNSTLYVSPKQLIANITIDAAATVSKWDVRVASKGCCKGGIGIELFEVKLRPNDPEYTSIWEFHTQLSDGSPTAIVGDGRAADGVSTLHASSGFSGAYANAACGTQTRLFVSGSGDATLDPDMNWSKRLPCPRRYFDFSLTSSQVVRSGAFTNALNVWGTETTSETPMGWRLDLRDCERLIFGDRGFIAVKEGRAPVRVNRVDDGTGPRVWDVESQPPHSARCIVYSKGEYIWTGPVYAVPFRVRITEVHHGP